MTHRRTSGTTVDDVRRLALALPDTEERPSYGTPGFRVKDKLFARVLDADSIVVAVDLEWRDSLVESDPDVFSVTPHYLRYPWVIVRLAAVGNATLHDLLAEAARLSAPAKRPSIRKRPIRK